MGIVNVTPDSFSDGGRFLATESAVQHGLQLVQEGAGILDVGGESTRPGAEPVTIDEELQRIIPVIRELARQTSTPISVDTRKPEVAIQALQAGACIVNDIEANRHNPGPMWEVLAKYQAGYVCMHMQGTPATMQANPSYTNVTTEVSSFFAQQLTAMQSAGINPEQIALDVGIGFGKSPAHNLRLLAALQQFTAFNRPLLIGASRKSFIGAVTGCATENRLPGSLACACWASLHGAQLLRVHEVAETKHAIQIIEAITQQKPDHRTDT
ncbi:MAG: hypothetical protein RI897_918 [Verrucomicrobiota bacterium]|jgi:dihydropteroate synthase